jgi:ABC-type antimicrobial peptide transport system permease subunit
MTFWTLIRRSLRFHARAHLGVVLGATVGSAALVGALIVGDSVRGSLRDLALQRLGSVRFALENGDRLFGDRLADRLRNAVVRESGGASKTGPGSPVTIVPVLKLAATAINQSGTARANRVQLLGIDARFAGLAGSALFSNLPPGAVVLNEALAAQLNAAPGDSVVLRARKPGALNAESPIASPDGTTLALRLRVQAVASVLELGNLNLAASQIPPFNAFVPLGMLQDSADAATRANLLLVDLPEQPATAMPHTPWYQVLAERWKLNLPFLRGKLPPQLGPSPSQIAQAPQELLAASLEKSLVLEDLQLELRPLPGNRGMELRSERIFLDRPIAAAVFNAAANRPGAPGLFASRPYGVLTYMVNLLRCGDRATPYSMVSAGEPPLAPAGLRDDEIIISQWLADDLQAAANSEIELSYFMPDQTSRLIERTNHFRVRAVLPMDDPALDRSLMPGFPGVARAEKPGDWRTSFPLVHKLRAKDEEYWKQYRGTPKAFVTLAAGQQMWQNRFGDLTAIRFPPVPLPEVAIERPLRRVFSTSGFGTLDPSTAAPPPGTKLFDPASVGFRFTPVRAEAIKASAESQDFSGLFLGFSFFLILAALILMALLFQFGLEQRATEVGTLLALGFPPSQVRRLLLFEGTALALLGGAAGVLGGIGYARAVLHGLRTLWRDAVGTSALHYHATPQTLAIGASAGVVVSAITIALVLRRQARRPARELLAEGADAEFQMSNSRPAGRSRGAVVAIAASLAALAIIGWAFWREETAAGAFFGAGALFLVAGLGFAAALFAALDRAAATHHLSVAALGLRGCTRRRRRSLATVALLACGSFMIIAIDANRLEANLHAEKRSAGTGGFALIGESALPVVHDLNTSAGRDAFGLQAAMLQGVSVVPLRVHDGDEASCLNLNRAQQPRLLGVQPELLQSRRAFTFAKVEKGLSPELAWRLLKRKPTDDAVPAIGDAASIEWALGKKIGDTLDYTDQEGRPFKIRLVGAVANSVLQGNLLIDEAQFTARFPGETGYRMFLVDAPSNSVARVSATLGRALQDVGLELMPAARRLAAYNAVQNTYLNTFQVLGGLGLLLGSVGLGVVVLRNVLERRGELALLQAVGFSRRLLQWLILSEHGGLLLLGLAVGMLAALVAILPELLAPGAETHWFSVGVTLAAVLANGLLWTWLATWLSARSKLLPALRNE